METWTIPNCVSLKYHFSYRSVRSFSVLYLLVLERAEFFFFFVSLLSGICPPVISPAYSTHPVPGHPAYYTTFTHSYFSLMCVHMWDSLVRRANGVTSISLLFWYGWKADGVPELISSLLNTSGLWLPVELALVPSPPWWGSCSSYTATSYKHTQSSSWALKKSFKNKNTSDVWVNLYVIIKTSHQLVTFKKSFFFFFAVTQCVHYNHTPSQNSTQHQHFCSRAFVVCKSPTSVSYWHLILQTF